jgi:murein DD-endopeptidase MepM/ murein hydrolase activator NlpD
MRFHKGMDFAAPLGTPVYATADGTVEMMEWRGNYGRLVVLRHEKGLESRYAHLSGYEMGLRVGGRVAQGQVIGYVGASGLATGPHLDFELRVGGQPIDPAVMMSLW